MTPQGFRCGALVAERVPLVGGTVVIGVCSVINGLLNTDGITQPV